MAISELITSPADALKRSAYPSLSTPLARAEGLLVRFMVRGRSVTPQQLLALSDLLCAAGGAIISVTARGELEISRVNGELYSVLAAALPRTLDIESGFIIDHSPLLGDDPTDHPQTPRLVAALAEQLRPLQERLGEFVRVVVDGGGAIDLSPLDGDVRITSLEGDRWAISLGGSRAEIVDYDTALSTSMALLSALAALGPEAKAEDLFVAYGATTRPMSVPRLGDIKLTYGTAVAIGVPSDGLSNDHFTRLAKVATSLGVTRIRLAPSSVLLLDNAGTDLIAQVHQLGFATAAPIPFSRAAEKLDWVLNDVQALDYRGEAIEHLLTSVTPGSRLLVAVEKPDDAEKIAALLTSAGYGHSIIAVIENANTERETLRTQMAEFFQLTDIGANAICAISVVAVPQGLPTSSTANGPWG